ncbi:MAG: class 1 fructose-bisphosphatase [Gammaproteobacteria bacterium]|nr:class 1 fructose-bisphosphatase [Gammaproteobacteria bacterium]
MLYGRTTLSKFLIEQLRDDAALSDLSALLIDVAAAIKSIAAVTARGALGGHLDAAELRAGGEQTRQRFNQIAHDAIVGQCEWGGLVAGMLSEELRDLCPIPREYPRGNYLLCFDPLDGSSNLDVNVAVGSIFSVLRHSDSQAPGPADFLRPGTEQVAAGYALYGPCTLLVLTVGRGTHGFTLDREIGNFILTHPDLRIAEDTSSFSINVSNERFWEPPVQRYVEECKAGKSGIRERDFNMRWVASICAEVHRILMRGGVFLYPRDIKEPGRRGRYHLLYEAAPMAMLIEQAGGAASTGRSRLLDLTPTELHQRVPVILGSRNEVERLERYHREYDEGTDRPFVSPLFNERSLYRAETE